MQGLFFFFFLVSFSLGQHLAFSIFIDHKYSRLALTPVFGFICERYQQARTALTPASAKPILTPPLRCYSPWPVLKYLFSFSLQFFLLKKKVFYLLIFTDFCQHLTLSLDFSLPQFGSGVKCMLSVLGLFPNSFIQAFKPLGWALSVSSASSISATLSFISLLLLKIYTLWGFMFVAFSYFLCLSNSLKSVFLWPLPFSVPLPLV